MSNLDPAPRISRVGGLADVAPRPVHELFAGREVTLGQTRVRRVLPNLGRRLVGAWCFVDHYGPDDIAELPGMQVPPHPHLGLQTVSWLLSGEVRHRDSIGNDQLVRPGELGLMTSGSGIAHAEHSPVPHPALLHGLQLWVALPDESRAGAPAWGHHASLPVLADAGMTATVLLGSMGGAASPGRTYSPLLGADVALPGGGDGLLPLEPEFEYALLCLSGSIEVENATPAVGSMLYLGCGRRDLRLRAHDEGARVLLLGGAPFDEQIVMWWNFVGRTGEEIAAARAAWQGGTGFGAVPGAGEPLSAPPLPAGRLRPGGSIRNQGGTSR
ncbi:MAG: pirin family protein [Jatrophihabitantaceae bacterium]